MLTFVRQTGLDCMPPSYPRLRKVDGVHGIRRSPFLQFLKAPTKVLEHWAVHVLDLSIGRHHRDETRNRLDDEARALFREPKSFLPSLLLSMLWKIVQFQSPQGARKGRRRAMRSVN